MGSTAGAPPRLPLADACRRAFLAAVADRDQDYDPRDIKRIVVPDTFAAQMKHLVRVQAGVEARCVARSDGEVLALLLVVFARVTRAWTPNRNPFVAHLKPHHRLKSGKPRTPSADPAPVAELAARSGGIDLTVHVTPSVLFANPDEMQFNLAAYLRAERLWSADGVKIGGKPVRRVVLSFETTPDAKSSKTAGQP